MEAVFWIAQGIGLIGLWFSILAYQAKTREKILDRQMLGAVVYMAHFGLLSAWTGFAMNAIVAIRNWIFTKNGSAPWASHKGWMYFFMALSVVALFFTWEGYISLLPALAMVLGVYARWQEKVSTIRLYSLIGVMLWLPYTVVVHSYSGILTNVIIGGAIVYGMFRHDRLANIRKFIGGL